MRSVSPQGDQVDRAGSPLGRQVEESLVASMNQSSLSSQNDQNGYNDSGISNGLTAMSSPGNRSSVNNRSSRAMPKVFGMPDSKFYNCSYLEKTGIDDYRRSVNYPPVKDPLPQRHYHRPENFSYSSVKRDFKADKPGTMRDVLHSKSVDGSQSEENLVPMERDDWPGPPEPAAAYPELLREKVYRRKSFTGSDVVDAARPSSSLTSEPETAESQRISKDIEELSKLQQDSGTAAVILRDLKKKRSTSPTLDPRNASRTPSAALEPISKTRYETPYFKSPSRDLDLLDQSHRRSRSNERELLNRSGAKSADITRSFAVSPRPGYTLRGGTSMENRNSYHDGLDGEERRPQSSVGVLESSGRHSEVRGSQEDNDYDPNTGLRHSYSSHMKSVTLPAGISPGNYFDSRLTPIPRANETVKVYSLAELKASNAKQLPGVDKDCLERHLSATEFESVFQMPMAEFYRQPAWKRSDAKTRAGLA